MYQHALKTFLICEDCHEYHAYDDNPFHFLRITDDARKFIKEHKECSYQAVVTGNEFADKYE